MSDQIAGHTFAGLDGRCTCGKRFSDISGVEKHHIGMQGWAHTAGLTEPEYHQIVAERERMWGAVVGAASAPK